MGKKVSMQQIADAVGVSKYAVSKALAGKEGVSRQTRDKIIETATQLGYRKFKPVQVGSIRADEGRSFDSSKDAAHSFPNSGGPGKQTVAVLMPNVRSQTIDSDFWGIVIQGISEALKRHGLGMLIVTETASEHFEQVINPDALLGLIGVGEIPTEMLLSIRGLGIPFVLTDHEDPLVPADAIFADNVEGAARLASHLYAQGHRDFLFIGDTRYSRSFMERWNGFRQALEELQVSVDPLRDKLPLTTTMGEAAVHMLQAWMTEKRGQGKPELPTAWVCANDALALLVKDVLLSEGIDVPAQISITGFDNIEESRRTSTPLTTIHVLKDRMGERAVAALLDRIRDPDRPTEKIHLSCEMLIRSSTGPVPV